METTLEKAEATAGTEGRVVHLRLSASLFAELQRAADQDYLTLSAYLRQMIARHLGRQS